MLHLAGWVTPFFLLVLCGFVGTASTLMLVTVINWMRVQGVQQAWRRGALYGWPAAPLAFLALCAALVAAAAWNGRSLEAVIVAGYACGGAFWLVSAALTRTVLVTRRGVVRHVNRPSQAFSWARVADYVCRDAGGGAQQYVFFVQEGGARRRVEVRVPAAQRAAFQATVEATLDVRFERSLHAVYGREAMEE